ncbi:hypothetical protein DRW07_08230 [Alteromonas sediminis]|uniref:DUF1801 domain-containing protein n=1 Tax=Alteromonas sediminis TaxID=2259342 RepID=A0A3N5Y321_9ALTE|nr:hypothetical protein [Alteromonas sediminis]RPJ67493.1 hypothetical protein DRW07_08230 [Alteromonas sediminis]
MDNPEEIFHHLREILFPYKNGMVVATDNTENFYLNTHHVMKNKKPMYFGSVKINKRYVSFHLMPVYVFPELLEGISPELKKRMQGKSCFNFKATDEKLFQELKALTHAGYEKYQEADYL